MLRFNPTQGPRRPLLLVPQVTVVTVVTAALVTVRIVVVLSLMTASLVELPGLSNLPSVVREEMAKAVARTVARAADVVVSVDVADSAAVVASVDALRSKDDQYF